MISFPDVTGDIAAPLLLRSSVFSSRHSFEKSALPSLPGSQRGICTITTWTSMMFGIAARRGWWKLAKWLANTNSSFSLPGTCLTQCLDIWMEDLLPSGTQIDAFIAFLNTLIKNGITFSHYHGPALDLAIRSGFPDLVAVLLEGGIPFPGPCFSENPFMALMTAVVQTGMTPRMIRLLIHHPRTCGMIDPRDHDDLALRQAAEMGNLEMVLCLLCQYRANPNAARAEAMMNAVRSGNTYVVDALAVRGGKVSDSLLMIAARRRDKYMLTHLVEVHGCDPNSKNGELLLRVVYWNYPELVGLLVGLGAVLDYQNHLALCTSVDMGYMTMTRELIRMGANVNARRGYPVRAARKAGHSDLLSLLLSSGAKMESFWENRGTPKHMGGIPMKRTGASGTSLTKRVSFAPAPISSIVYYNQDYPLADTATTPSLTPPMTPPNHHHYPIIF